MGQPRPRNAFALNICAATAAFMAFTLVLAACGGGGGAPGEDGGATGTLLFAATDANSPGDGIALWKTNGTPEGTELVIDLNPGTPSFDNDIGDITRAGSVWYFMGDDGTTGRELYKTDGTAAGTARVRDIRPGAADSEPGPFFVFGGQILFQAHDGTTGWELWGSDGTQAGTQLLDNINPDAASPGHSFPHDFTKLGGDVFFGATGPTQAELYRTDGSVGGSALVEEIFAGGSAGPSSLVAFDGRVIFSAFNGNTTGLNGRELWEADAAGASLLLDINPGTGNSNPSDLTVFGNLLLFVADNGSDGDEFWRYDGTSAPTMIADLNPGSPDGVSSFAANVRLGSYLYFRGDNGTTGTELYRTDGTTIELAQNIAPDVAGPASSFPFGLLVAGGRLFFIADDGPSQAVWVSDGSPGDATKVSGFPGNAFSSQCAAILGEVGGRAVVNFERPGGYELWATDGTAAGTEWLADVATAICE